MDESEEFRIEQHLIRIAEIYSECVNVCELPTAEIDERIAYLESLNVDDSWEEFKDDAFFAVGVSLLIIKGARP